jgi:hypothetical protein
MRLHGEVARLRRLRGHLGDAWPAPTAAATAAVVTSVELGATNTVVHFRGGEVVSDFDIRVEVRVREAARPTALTVTTAGGEAFTVRRADGAVSGERDPAYATPTSPDGLEVNRSFALLDGGEEGLWGLSVIACPEWARFGDGAYTLSLACDGGAAAEVSLWFGEAGGGAPLPFPANDGFSAPDHAAGPLPSTVAFTWEQAR